LPLYVIKRKRNEGFRNPQILSGNPRRNIFEEKMIRDQRVKTLWKAGFEKVFRNPQILVRRPKESNPSEVMARETRERELPGKCGLRKKIRPAESDFSPL
jgi:hypothetical protein